MKEENNHIKTTSFNHNIEDFLEMWLSVFIEQN